MKILEKYSMDINNFLENLEVFKKREMYEHAITQHIIREIKSNINTQTNLEIN